VASTSSTAASGDSVTPVRPPLHQLPPEQRHPHFRTRDVHHELLAKERIGMAGGVEVRNFIIHRVLLFQVERV